MSTSLEIYNFVKSLSPRDRSFYLMMRAYEIHVSNVIESTYDPKIQSRTVDILSSLFKDEIIHLTRAPLTGVSDKSPVYVERIRNENAEISTIDSGFPEIKIPVDIESYHLRPSDKFVRPNDRTPFNMVSSNIQPVDLSILPKMNTETEQIPIRQIIDDPHAEKLGDWASSFSFSSESGSDLSSEDD